MQRAKNSLKSQEKGRRERGGRGHFLNHTQKLPLKPYQLRQSGIGTRIDKWTNRTEKKKSTSCM